MKNTKTKKQTKIQNPPREYLRKITTSRDEDYHVMMLVIGLLIGYIIFSIIIK